MSGDLENVKLLLSRGAKPSESALAQAVTFGYPDVVRTLIAAGANTGIIAASGLNLLHWAVVTNRPAIIPALVEARVPINAIDDNGFTPLMYTATLDYGETGALETLLKAGADRSIKNEEGRTPLQQAQRLGHKQHATAMKQVR